MADFNGQAYLEDNGFSLQGVTEKPGVVLVKDQFGNDGELDLQSMLRDQGVDEPVNFNLNSVDAPLTASPVGFSDRAALSLGNSEGQLSYLKSKFQDATIQNDELLVKDKGAWHKVDGSMFGDGQGWDLSRALNEFAGNVADLTDDIISAGGGLAGAVLGTGVGPGGTLAGAAAGGALSRGAIIAMGRAVGTYEGTAEDVLKDVALDAVLSMGGEAIAVGAKNAVIPGIKKALVSIGDAAVPAEVKSRVAGMMSTFMGMSERSADRAVTNPELVTKRMDSIIANLGDLPATDTNLVEASKFGLINQIKEVIDPRAAQNRLSGMWREGEEKIVNLINDGQPIDPKGAAATYLKDMADAGWVNIGQDGNIAAFTPAEIQTKFAGSGVDDATATKLSRIVNSSLRRAGGLLSGEEAIAPGKEGARESLKLMRAIRDISEELSDVLQNTGSTDFKAMASNFESKMAQAMGADVSKELTGLASMYAFNKPHVLTAQRLMNKVDGNNNRSVTKQLEGFVNGLFTAADQNLADYETLKVLSSWAPNGQQVYDRVLDSVAAHETIRSAPKGSVGGGMIANAVGQFTSPRMAAKGLAAGTKELAAFGQMFKKMGKSQSLQVLQDTQAVNALMQGLAQSVGPIKRTPQQ